MEADANSTFKESILDINGVRTLVIQYGLTDSLNKISDSSTETNSPLSNFKYAVVMIPGNPGSIQFYKHFLRFIYEQLNIPVIGVSHAGHVALQSISTQTKDGYYSVKDQIEHKVQFIKDYFPKDVKLIFLGHSLGAYIILELLELFKKPGEDREIARSILLFPVIERLYEIWRAKVFSVLFFVLWFPILVFVFFLNLFSETYKRLIVRFVIENIYKCRNYPECIIDGGSNFYSTTVIKNIITVFQSEVREISELRVPVIRNRLETLSMMYGVADPWCPLSYYEEMCQRFPDGDITLPFRTIPHAFVVDKNSSDKVAEIVCENIKRHVQMNE